MKSKNKVKSVNKNRILIIAPSFVPKGSSQVEQAVNLVKYLNKLQWNIAVLTLSTESLTNLGRIWDDSLLKKLPNSVKIFRTFPGIVSALIANFKEKKNTLTNQELINYSIKNLYLKIMVPDHRVEWLPFAVYKGIKIINSINPKLILTLSGPFSAHLVGYILKKLFRIPWIAFYSDPWVDAPDRIVKVGKFRQFIEKTMERKILKTTDKVIVVTSAINQIYLKNYPFIKDKIKVIPLGFDPEDFQSSSFVKFSKFTIIYAGTLLKKYAGLRDPIPFLKALCLLLDEKKITSKDLQIIFLGNLDEEYKKTIQELKLQEIVSFRGWVESSKSLQYMKSAHVLILFGNVGRLQIPAKLYQYIGAQRPILMIKKEKQSLESEIIREINRGLIVDNDPISIKNALLKLYNWYKENKLDTRFNLEYVDKYSWREIIWQYNKCITTAIKARKNK